MSYLPGYIINEFTKQIHRKTTIQGKPDGKTHFLILKNIVEMTWKTLNMQSSIKAYKNTTDAASNRKVMNVNIGYETQDESSSSDSDLSTSSVNMFQFPCAIHDNSHELGKCRLFLSKTNTFRKQLCTRNKLCWTCLKPNCFNSDEPNRPCKYLQSLPEDFVCSDCTGRRPFNILTCTNEYHDSPDQDDFISRTRSYFKVLKSKLLYTMRT